MLKELFLSSCNVDLPLLQPPGTQTKRRQFKRNQFPSKLILFFFFPNSIVINVNIRLHRIHVDIRYKGLWRLAYLLPFQKKGKQQSAYWIPKSSHSFIFRSSEPVGSGHTFKPGTWQPPTWMVIALQGELANIKASSSFYSQQFGKLLSSDSLPSTFSEDMPFYLTVSDPALRRSKTRLSLCIALVFKWSYVVFVWWKAVVT